MRYCTPVQDSTHRASAFDQTTAMSALCTGSSGAVSVWRVIHRERRADRRHHVGLYGLGRCTRYIVVFIRTINDIRFIFCSRSRRRVSIEHTCADLAHFPHDFAEFTSPVPTRCSSSQHGATRRPIGAQSKSLQIDVLSV